MPRATLLAVDGIGNVALGVILLAEPVRLARWLGIPNVTSGFYPSLFGAVLFGIGLALLLELYRPSSGARGLGLTGALVINFCFGLVLAGWLFFGDLGLPLHGAAILWALVGILVGLSGIELVTELRSEPREAA